MAGHTHLYRRGSRYYFYRRIPKEVLKAFPDKQFIKETLGTADFEEAKRKVREVSCEWDRRFDHERRKLAGQYDEISDTLAEEIAARWLENAAWNDEYSRQFKTRSDAEIDAESDAAFFHRVDYQEALAKGDRKPVEGFMKGVERAEGLNVERGSISHGTLSLAILRAAIEAMDIVEARNSGEWVKPPPAAPSASNMPTTAAPLEGGEPLSAIFAKWKAERQPSKKLASESGKAIRRFTEVYGDLPVRGITLRHVASFKDDLLKVPARPVKALRNLPLPEQIKRAERDGDLARLSVASVKKDLGILRAVLEWAFENGYRNDNPATGIKIREARNTGPRRLPYEAADLQRIFSCDIFTNGDRPRGGGGEAAYWLPLLALFTGSRLEELGQLLASDVRQAEGVWYLDINMRDAGKRLKTKSSERKVPLHHQLIGLGFLDYADSQRQGGDAR